MANQLISPNCPVCSSEMLEKVATKGKYKGEPFWGCSAFPKCKQIPQMEDSSTSGDHGGRSVTDQSRLELIDSILKARPSNGLVTRLALRGIRSRR